MSKFTSFMLTALNQAEIAANNGEVPVGAVIWHSRFGLISEQHNLIETMRDATAHAEILAIREASAKLNSRYLDECSMYVTLEPCLMCAYAISLSRIKTLHFAAYDYKRGAVVNGVGVFSNKYCDHIPEVYIGDLAENSENLLKDFFADLRKKMLK